MNTLTPERFEELRIALGWGEERAGVVEERLVKGRSYSALALLTGRAEEAVRAVVYRARKEILAHEAAERGDPDPDPLEAIEHAYHLAFAMEFAATVDEALAAVRIVDGNGRFWRHTEKLTPAEQRERNLELIAYKYQRDLGYVLGATPPP